MVYRVAIWDDDLSDLDSLSTLAEAIFREAGRAHSIDCFLTQESLLRSIDAGPPYHLLLLDILCDGRQGMELAAQLRDRRVESSIIFVSSSKDYVLEGYDVHAVSYLLKPPDRDRLADAIGYAVRHGPHPSQAIALKIGGEWTSIRQQDVVYLESALHNVLLHLLDGTALKCRGKIDEMAERFFDVPFAKCHNSYRVNLSCVRRVQREWVEVEGGRRLPVSRGQAEAFIADFLLYKTGGWR